MGFFNKILVQEIKTGNLIDIVNLDKEHYERFLDAMEQIRKHYFKRKRKINHFIKKYEEENPLEKL